VETSPERPTLMPVPESQRALHREADRFTPRTRRAFVKAAERMRARVSVEKLAEALASKNMARALAAVGEAEFERALEPFGAILRDAFVKGGKIGAKFL